MIVVEPTGNVEVVTLATPLAIAGEPKMVEPAVIVTVPVALAGSIAVKVTACPTIEGLTEDEKCCGRGCFAYRLRRRPGGGVIGCVPAVGRGDHV